MDPFLVSMSLFPTIADLLLAVLANIGPSMEQPSSRTLFILQRAACSQFQGPGTSTRRKTQCLWPGTELSRNPPWAGATAGRTPSCSRSLRPERAQHQAELRDLPEPSVSNLSFDATKLRRVICDLSPDYVKPGTSSNSLQVHVIAWSRSSSA